MKNDIGQLVAWDDLPDDMWVKIFRSLQLPNQHGTVPKPISVVSKPQRLLRTISLVSKRFHNLSKYALMAVVLLQPSQTVHLTSICNRFTCIKFVMLVGPTPDLDTIINQLAHAVIPLQHLQLINQTHFPRDPMRMLGHNMRKTLKLLTLNQFKTLVDEDLDVVADCFPYIEYLAAKGNMNAGQITDEGVRLISIKIKTIKILNLYEQPNISCRSLQYLASYCPLLKGLFVGAFRTYNENISVFCLTQFIFSQSLSFIGLFGVKISESMLASFAAANLKIWGMAISHPCCSTDIKGATLCRFFKSFEFLCCLTLVDFPFPLDITANDFSRSIPNVEILTFHSGRNIDSISAAVFFSLIKECSLLLEIKIISASLQPLPEWNNFPVHSRVRELSFMGCPEMNDEMLLLIVSACPKLGSLALTKCPNITDEGIQKLKTCSNIKFLSVEACINVSDIVLDKDG